MKYVSNCLPCLHIKLKISKIYLLAFEIFTNSKYKVNVIQEQMLNVTVLKSEPC